MSDETVTRDAYASKNMGKTLDFKSHLFFSILGGDPSQLESWSKRSVEPLKLFREAIQQVSEDRYHTEFVLWHIDHFYFLSTTLPRPCLFLFLILKGDVTRTHELGS